MPSTMGDCYLTTMNKARQRIAVVDDEGRVLKALDRLLRSAGMDVSTFGEGLQFLASLGTRQYDCVVLDLHMPEVNGFDVQARLGELGHALPVIIITGHDTPEACARARAGGAAAYLLKPVDERTLLNAILFVTSDQRR
jgi:FixJ family two-component response regulator